MNFETTNDLLNRHIIKAVEQPNSDNNLHESQGDSSKELLDDKDLLHLVT